MDMTKRRLLIGGSTAVLATALSGCGTLLYPERKGQTGGRIDPSVAILDGLGLLLFLIPGLIAFAVDFSNGTIYLPENYGHPAPFELSELQRRRLNDKTVTLDTVASLARNDFARI